MRVLHLCLARMGAQPSEVDIPPPASAPTAPACEGLQLPAASRRGGGLLSPSAREVLYG